MMILLFQLIGGIGLFLLGMVLLTDGLKSFAGDALRLPPTATRVSQMHAIDHMLRLRHRLSLPAALRRVPDDERLRRGLALVRRLLELADTGLGGNAPSGWLADVRDAALELTQLRERERPAVMRQTAGGHWGPATALDVLDAMRWLERVSYHVWRTCHHLAEQTATDARRTDETRLDDSF